MSQLSYHSAIATLREKTRTEAVDVLSQEGRDVEPLKTPEYYWCRYFPDKGFLVVANLYHAQNPLGGVLSVNALISQIEFRGARDSGKTGQALISACKQ